MAYLLRFDGVNDYVTLQSVVGGAFADRLDVNQEWVLEWKFKRSGSDGYVHRFFDYEGGSQDSVLYRASDGLFRMTLLSGGPGAWTGVSIDTINPATFRVVKYAGTNIYELFLDTGTGFVSQGTRTAAVQIFNFNTIGRDNGSGYINGDLYYVSYITSNSGVNFNADPSASSGTGTTLPDAVGSNDGTLVNFPVDDSQWVEYASFDPAQFYTVDGVPAPVVIPDSYTPSATTTGQTLVITEKVLEKMSQAEQDAFWNNVESTGGDLRLATATDGTQQLPIELVSFDSAARTFVLWTRRLDYDGLGTMYLFFGKAGETQPAVTDPFGRNAVWQEYSAALHYDSPDNATWVDSSGKAVYEKVAPDIYLSKLASGKIGGGALNTDGGDFANSGLRATAAIPDFTDKNVYYSEWVKGLELGTWEGLWCHSSVTSSSFNSDILLTRAGNEDRLVLQGNLSGFSSSIRFPFGTLSTFNDGNWNLLSFSLDTVNGVARLYKNGVEIGLVSSDILANLNYTSANRLKIFSGHDNGSYNAERDEFRLNFSDELVSQDRIATEYANQSDPATFFGTPTLATTGGVVSYTITLDSGSYTLVGEQLNLLSDRTLSLQNGGYSLSGGELNLSVQRTINLSGGIYTKQGTDTGFILDRFLSLDTGSYSYIGTDLNLQYGREFRLTLEQGSYSLQGAEIGVLKDYVLPTDSSNYTYTSDNVSLLANRRITTDAGDYSYTGSNVNFVYEALGLVYTLSLDSGTYNLTGDSLKLLVNRILPIDFGHYVYEGVDSKLLYNRAIALDSGVYSSSGTNLGVKVNRRLVFQDGNYSLQGTPVTLSYTGEVLAILEGYNLTYKKHPVQSKYKTYNITARYN